ncbi:radical SAM protein [Candidatus Saccharibacteria bacterium]|nr:radical SAM protein [Candidatus Saccharibacteria bacterium]
MTLPSVRVAVTEQCNLRCDYCPLAGDSVEMQRERLDYTGLERLVCAALDVGFTNFSFTGGEPLLTDNTADTTFRLAELVNAKRSPSDGYTKLNTNGANLLRFYDGLIGAGFDELKISLDSLRADTFTKLSHRSKRTFDKTLEGILKVKDSIPVRLQTVVGKYNEDEIPAMIQFCIENGLDIKLFDLSSYDNALSGSRCFADDNFVSLSAIANELQEQYGEPVIKYAVGNVGHPKKVFTTPEGTRIELRDTTKLAHYSSELCRNCPNYMCQDGLCNIVIAADGHIQMCREGGAEQTISLCNTDNNPKNDAQLRTALAAAASIFSAARPIEKPDAIQRKKLPIVSVD